MEEKYFHIYRQVEDRYVKISWTHKIQEIQAGLYIKKSNSQKWWMAIANGVTTTSAFVSVVTNALEVMDTSWVWPAITSLIAVISSIITLRFKDGVLESKASACKQYAAKCRHIRNMYESLLADIKSGCCEFDEMCKKRDIMTEQENALFTGETAPHTTPKAVELARKSLLENKDSLTEQHEIKSIVPEHLQEL